MQLRVPSWMWRQRRHGGGEPLVLIYQMGKVASVAVEAALKRRLDWPVHRLHFMSDQSIARYQAVADRGRAQNDVPHAFLTSLQRQIDEARRMREVCDGYRERGDKIYVITGVREPVGLAIAGFFQNIATITPMYRQWFDGDPEFAGLLQRLFVQLWRQSIAGDDGATTAEAHLAAMFAVVGEWFDDELKPTLGLDVYEHPVDHHAGYLIHRTDALDLFAYRFNDAERVLAPGLMSFLRIEGVDLDRMNESAAKTYAPLLDAFKATLALPSDLTDHAYALRYVRHFYSADQIDGMRNRWRSPADGPPRLGLAT